MRQFLFYQHNVQQFFLRHREKYAGVIAPLSIATSFPDGTQGFLRALFARDPEKQFLIDPRLPLFQKKWQRTNVRAPHVKVAEIFGGPVQSKGLARPLEPSDLPDDALEELTERCVRHQEQFRHRPQDQRKIEKYKKLAGGALPPIANPQLFIPPYFEFATEGDAWHAISMKCVSFACRLVDPTSLRPIVHFARFREAGSFAATIRAFEACGVRSAFLYPNNFREHDKPFEELDAYRQTVEAFFRAGIEPYALHGGFLAMAFSKVGLGGFANGVGYGEWRDSGYHKGGSAEKRIYLPKLHRFLEPAAAQNLIMAEPGYFASDSELLDECTRASASLLTITLEQSLDHFMESRAAEIAAVEGQSLEQIVAELVETVRVLGDLGPVYTPYADELSRWIQVLS